MDLGWILWLRWELDPHAQTEDRSAKFFEVTFLQGKEASPQQRHDGSLEGEKVPEDALLKNPEWLTKTLLDFGGYGNHLIQKLIKVDLGGLFLDDQPVRVDLAGPLVTILQ